AVGRAVRHSDGHDDLVRFVDTSLCVVALFEAIAHLHDPALRIGEVVLRLLGWLTELVLERLPFLPLGPAAVAFMTPFRAILVGLPLFEPLLRFTDLLESALPSLHLFRKLISALVAAVLPVFFSIRSLGLLDELRDLALQFLLFLLHPVIAHRLMPAGVRRRPSRAAAPRAASSARWPSTA